MSSALALASGVFLSLIGLVCLFQLALICGAPWGELTLAGRWRGRLPWHGRLIAAISFALLLLFAVIVSNRAGWLLTMTPAQTQIGCWLVTGYSALGLIANGFSPSPRERQLWLPVVTLMLLSSLIISLSAQATA